MNKNKQPETEKKPKLSNSEKEGGKYLKHIITFFEKLASVSGVKIKQYSVAEKLFFGDKASL